jgi:hypothetical protein
VYSTSQPRPDEIITLIGSHNLLATPTGADLDNDESRPLIDRYLHGADDVDAEQRAACSGWRGTSSARRSVAARLLHARPGTVLPV